MQTFTIYRITETGRDVLARITGEEPACWMAVIEGFLGGHVSAGVYMSGQLLVVEDERGEIWNYTRFANAEEARAASDARAA